MLLGPARTSGAVLRGNRYCAGGKRRGVWPTSRARLTRLVASAAALGCLALNGTTYANTGVPDPLPGSNETATVIGASPDTAVTNETVALTATVSSGIGAPYPAGSVAFENSGATIAGCGDVPVGPSAQSVTVVCSTAFPASTAELAAVFTPVAGSFLLGSESQIESVPVGPASSSTSLDAASPVGVGIRTIFTATVDVSSTGIGAIEPSGAVEFLDAGRPIGSCSSQPLIDGAATCAVRYRAAGARAITARYLGDANFAASSSPTELVRASAAPVGGAGTGEGVLGTITSTMQWTFYFTPTSTMVRALVVNGTSVGATVSVDCHGHGCPFARRAIEVADNTRCGVKTRRMCSGHGTVLITPGFANRHLGVGARITVAITKPSWVGKHYAFTIEAGRAPRVQITCLAPGATRPGGGC
jgi:hypothetical protein